MSDIKEEDNNKKNTQLNDSQQTNTNSRKQFTNNNRPTRKGNFNSNNKQNSNLSFEVLVQRRVSTTREGGEKMSFSVLSACGDKQGAIGLGLGKASDFAKATAKANNAAKKNMVSIFRKEDKISTIYHNTTIKKSGITLVITKPPSGQGLKCMAVIEKMCRMLGYTDLTVKTHGSRNGLNVAKLFFQALKEQIPTKQILAFKANSNKT